MADAVKIILSLITSNIENAVKGAGDLVGSGAKAVGNGATSVIKGVGGLVGLGGAKEGTNGTPAGAPAKTE